MVKRVPVDDEADGNRKRRMARLDDIAEIGSKTGKDAARQAREKIDELDRKRTDRALRRRCAGSWFWPSNDQYRLYRSDRPSGRYVQYDIVRMLESEMRGLVIIVACSHARRDLEMRMPYLGGPLGPTASEYSMWWPNWVQQVHTESFSMAGH